MKDFFKMKEELGMTTSAVPGAGDDSSTVIVRKKGDKKRKRKDSVTALKRYEKLIQRESKDSILKRVGVSGYNKPKATPNHPKKSHVVVAKDGDNVKTIRFGQQGVKGSPDGSKRNKSFKARHKKNIDKGKMSAAYWANKVKW